jgi:plastocyanin
MKTISTSKIRRYFILGIGFAFISLNLKGQISHLVTVSNFQFDPKQLSISAGDTIIWKNSGGSHNVDGNQSVFTSNPESFGNSVGAGWTYTFVFKTEGTYNYQCDPHAAMGMVGKIIVNPNSATSSPAIADRNDQIVLFPNPVSQYFELKVPTGFGDVSLLKIYSITGSFIGSKAFSEKAETIQYNVSQFRKGIYFVEINSGTRKEVLKFTKQ